MTAIYPQILKSFSNNDDLPLFRLDLLNQTLFLSETLIHQLNLHTSDNYFNILNQFTYKGQHLSHIGIASIPNINQIYTLNFSSELFDYSLDVKLNHKKDAENNLLDGLVMTCSSNHKKKSPYSQTEQVLVGILSRLIHYKDSYTTRHSARIKNYVLALGEQIKPTHIDVRLVAETAILHDIGKIFIPTEVLVKTTPLTKSEMEEIKKHPYSGSELIHNAIAEANVIDDVFLQTLMTGIESHHERWDGNGYPLGLQGDMIPMEGRLLSICDTYDALRSNRPYRDALTHNQALDIIYSESGKQFDPGMVTAFMAIEKNIEELALLDVIDYKVVHPDVEFTKWREELRLGHTLIDDQHKEILTNLNYCYTELVEKNHNTVKHDFFNQVHDYIKYHMISEEALLKDIEYIHYEEHVKLHKNFESTVNNLVNYALTNYVSQDGIKAIFLHITEMIYKHVLEEDSKFIPLINKKRS